MNRNINPSTQHIPTSGSQISHALLNGSHTPTKPESLENIVITNHLHILGNAQPALRHTLTKTKRHHIIAAEHGSRTAINNLISSPIATTKTVIPLNTQRRIKMLSRLLDSIHKTTTTLRGTRLRNVAGDNANTSMTTLQQILGSQMAAKIIIKTNRITPTALRQTVDQHHRARHKRHILTQPPSSIANAGLTRRNQHHTIHPTGRKTLQQLMLSNTRIIGIGHNQRIPLRGAFILHALGKCRKKQVLNIRHNERHQLGLLGHQASRALIRHIIQFLRRIGNDLALPLRHASRTIIQHQRNRRHRHPRGSSHILQRRTIRHPNPLKTFIPPA